MITPPVPLSPQDQRLFNFLWTVGGISVAVMVLRSIFK